MAKAASDSPVDRQAAGWTDYWRKEGVGGEVFVGPENQRHEKLAGFWRETLGGCASGTAVLDIACGAGSVFATLPQEHGLKLHGSDVSTQALRLLKERIPGVKTLEASATQISYPDHNFGRVVSQFGLEYAGIEAFTEAGRLVAADGAFDFLCHCEGGYVDQGTESQLEGAQVARSSKFALSAAQLVRAMFAREPNAVKRMAGEFQRSEAKLRNALAKHPKGIHAHLYHGFRQLYNDYKSYALEDILKWLADVSSEVEMTVSRLTQMRNAMLDDSAVRQATERLQDAGLDVREPKKLQFDEHDAPLAWHISGVRPRS